MRVRTETPEARETREENEAAAARKRLCEELTAKAQAADPSQSLTKSQREDIA
jgi:hypothetical protein